MEVVEEISRFGFSSNFITTLQEHYGSKGSGLRQICEKPAKMKVEEFIQAPSANELIVAEASLDGAIYQLSKGPFLSLMVMEENAIVGILRMSDVFAAVFHAMKENDTTQ